MGTKEMRWEIANSGSPLRHHSTNQYRLKLHREGEKRLEHVSVRSDLSARQQEGMASIAYLPKLMTVEFAAEVFPQMREMALKRTALEENLPIPQRVSNILTDTQRLYKDAREKGLAAAIVIVDNDLENISYPLRRDQPLYPDLIPHELFFLACKQIHSLKILTPASQLAMSTSFFWTFHVNTTSCDFRLSIPDQAVERVETYAYLLTTIGLFGQMFLPEMRGRALEDIAINFVDLAKKHLQRSKNF